MADTASFLDALRRYHLVEPKQLAELTTDNHGQAASPPILALKLVQQGLLTRYQANLVLHGKGANLVLGSYVLLEQIGSGGMGAVFQARNQESGQVVALKLMHKESLADADAVRRFEREIEATVQLNHPNIVRAFDAFEVNGTQVLVMEHVAGIDLSRLVREKGPLTIDQAVACIVQAARGLAHAHEAGIVHRDIKPGNLRLDLNGTVKVLDLGLARVRSGDNTARDGAASRSLTGSGDIMGTSDYMAPEQALNTKRADHRADVYSLGCTLWFLLTGRAMYDGETIFEVLVAHREKPIPLFASVRPDVPLWLESVFRRMVAKAVDERYESMTEVSAALGDGVCEESCAELGHLAEELHQRAAETEQVRAEFPSSLPSLPPKRRAGKLIAALLLLLLLVGVGFVLTRSEPQTTAPTKGTEAPRAAGVVNLLALIDLNKDVKSGTWSTKGNDLLVAPSANARVQFPYRPPAEYDLHFFFNRSGGTEGIRIILVGNGRQFSASIGDRANTLACLELVAGKTGDANVTGRKRNFWLRPDVTHRGQIQVRRKGVQVYFQGNEIIHLATDFTNVSLAEPWALTDKTVLGLGSDQTELTFSRFDVTEISGPGDFLRLEEPAAKKAVTERSRVRE